MVIREDAINQEGWDEFRNNYDDMLDQNPEFVTHLAGILGQEMAAQLIRELANDAGIDVEIKGFKSQSLTE